MSAYEILAEVPYFAALPENELEDLCRAAEIVEIKAGEVLIEEGQEIDSLLVVAGGAFEATRRTGGTDVVLGVAGTGEVLGEMSVLEGRPASATLTALSDGTLIRLPAKALERVLSNLPFLRGMFLTMIRRLREREASLVHAEKLVALGTMTAGLLHEINNPAAAIKRSAAGLVEAADQLLAAKTARQVTALQRAELEDEMVDFLEQHQVEPAIDLATSLVSAGWEVADLEEIGEGDPVGIGRIAHLIHARQLADEVAMAAGRLSELVGAVKTWVHLDQGPKQEVDLNKSIEQTASLLRHKLGEVRLDLELDPALPSFEGSGAELNQVITNIVDNAIQAAASSVTVRTSLDGSDIVCEIIDDGPGIPPELLERIWEPFFTTKPPGQGTGLGLSISRRIVESHRGRLAIESAPGRTRFVIQLPISSP
jgi:signal transduction histidine kinase